MKRFRLSAFGLVAVTCLVVLSACAGGDDEDPTPTPLPSTATVAPAMAPSPTATADPSTPAETSSSPSPVTSIPAAVGTPVAVTVILTDFRISAFQKEFVTGIAYTFTIQNNGSVPHQFIIEPMDAVNQPLTAGGTTASIDGIAPGETATMTWVFTEAGTLQFASHESNYYEQGMVQKNIVVR